MKKAKLWKIIIGIIIIVIDLIAVAYFVYHVPNKITETIARVVSILCWGFLGVYLVASYIKFKDRQDTDSIPTMPIVANGPEDIEALRTRRNKILASVLLIDTFLSIPTWITNNYRAGLVPDNIGIIFDMLVHLFIIYLIYCLYKNRNVLRPLFYTIIVITIVTIGIDTWKANWFIVAADALYSVYFIYYIKSTLSRKNYRISNFVILPLVLVIMIVLLTLGSSKSAGLFKEEQQQEADFATDALNVSTKYSTLVLESDFTKIPLETQDLKVALNVKEQKTTELLNTLDRLHQEDLKTPDDSVSQISLKRSEGFIRVLALSQTFDGKMEQMVTFFEGLKSGNLTAEERQTYRTLTTEVLNAQKDLLAKYNELNNIK